VQRRNWNKGGGDALLSRHNKMFGASAVNGIIYLVGLIVVVMAILSFLGMH
jgi:hypothetical protein